MPRGLHVGYAVWVVFAFHQCGYRRRAVAAWDVGIKPKWCGPVCVFGDEVARVGNIELTIPRRKRPFEALRYKVLEHLEIYSSESWPLLPKLWSALGKEWPLDIFHQVTEADLFECPWGLFVWRIARLAASRGDEKQQMAVVLQATHDFLTDDFETLQQRLHVGFCSGWPIFRLLYLVATLWRRTSEADAMRQHVQTTFIDSAAYPPSILSESAAAYVACSAAYPSSECLLQSIPFFDRMHAMQNQVFFGSNVCPDGTLAAWLDRMNPAPTFPLCVRLEYNAVDTALKHYGGYGKCTKLASWLDTFRPATKWIFDVGANIGVCSVMLAIMGYRVVAFEPLPRNADILEGSLRLNRIGPVNLHKTSAVGVVSLFRHALGERHGRAHIVEDRLNAGNSEVVVDAPSVANSNRTHLRHENLVRVARLDDLIGTDGDGIGLLKLDVQGSELRVLRGALALLRARAIRIIYFEWRPIRVSAHGDDPTIPLWLLHGLNYTLFAPRQWFDQRSTESDVVRLTPALFAQVLNRNGDLVAVANQ